MFTRANSNTRARLAGILGAAILFAAPSVAHADDGKWWTPRQGDDPRVERRMERRIEQRQERREGRRFQRVHRHHRLDARFHAHPYWGGALRRSEVVIRHGHRGHRYRVQRVYCAPHFHRGFVYVSPVRFYFATNARIGPVDVHVANFPDRDFVYGCNFCDLRFDTFRQYERHVQVCDFAPSGFRIHCEDWDSDPEYEIAWND